MKFITDVISKIKTLIPGTVLKRRLRKRAVLGLTLMLLIVVTLLLSLMLLIRKCSQEKVFPTIEATADLESILLKQEQYLYGIPMGDYDIETAEIASGETFSKLLNARLGLSMGKVTQLINLSKGKLDMREIRAGNTYAAFYTTDSTHTLQYLVYEKSITEYVVFGTGDSLYVQKEKKNAVVEERYAEGVIKSSLYGTISENNLSMELGNKLFDIFQWSIEFSTLQKGDSFRVIYEDVLVDTVSIGIGKVYGAIFNHGGKDYYAIRFKQGEEQGYWDEKGQNLRKSFLRAPLSFKARISSKFGMRVHPIRRVRAQHNGVDYACPAGTPVLAIADGTVVKKYFERGGGNTLILQHAQGLRSGYLHLRGYANGIAVGKRVKQGDVIAYVGSTGMSTGPHLDFRVWVNNKAIDPLKIPSIPSNPIAGQYKGAFEKMRQDVMDVMKEYQQK